MLGRKAILNPDGHLFYYSAAPFGGNCFPCNANAVLGGAILLLLHTCQGSVRRSTWPWSDLPGSPSPGHSHWPKGGSMAQAVSILPNTFQRGVPGVRTLPSGSQRREDWGLLVTLFPVTWRKETQPQTGGDETQRARGGEWNTILVSKAPRLSQISRIFSLIFWASLVSFQYSSHFCLSLSEEVSCIRSSKNP